MSTLSSEVKAALSGSSQTFDATEPAAPKDGPWPPDGPCEAIFRGFDVNVTTFRFSNGTTLIELPGVSIQARFESMNDIGEGGDLTEWKGEFNVIPTNLDKVIPQLPEASGLGNQRAVRATLARICGALTHILGADPGADWASAIDEANKLATAGLIGVHLAISSKEGKPDKNGNKRTYHTAYVNGVFDIK